MASDDRGGGLTPVRNPLAMPEWLRLIWRDGQPIGAEIIGTPDVGEWAEVTSRLLAFCRGMQWVVGDVLLGGEERFGEAYSQVLDAADYSPKTCQNVQYVAGRFGFSRRRENLEWAHHAEVAGMEPAEADRLLSRAAEENLTTRDLRRLVKAAKGLPPPAPFNAIAEADAITDWLRKRRAAWPEAARPGLPGVLRRIADALEDDEP